VPGGRGGGDEKWWVRSIKRLRIRARKEGRRGGGGTGGGRGRDSLMGCEEVVEAGSSKER
jgi:hypothetical protein